VIKTRSVGCVGHIARMKCFSGKSCLLIGQGMKSVMNFVAYLAVYLKMQL